MMFDNASRDARNEKSRWRLIKHTKGEAAWNMAVDEAMMRAIASAKSPPTVRLYQWEGFAVSLGRFQSIERTIRVQPPCESAIPLVRRITGGRGILHGDDLTVSIVCRCSDLGISVELSVFAIYEVLMEIFRHAFALMGIDTVQGSSARIEPRSRIGDCFAVASLSDLVEPTSGVKLIGGALHRIDDLLLFQASAPLNTAGFKVQVRELALRVFQGISANHDAENRHQISAGCLEASIIRAICEQLRVELCNHGQTKYEESVTADLCDARYRNADWTRNGRSVGNLVPN